MRLRFPWVLPPATPCTRHCIRSPYCYVSGRERGRRLQQQKQQPPLPLPRSASLPPLSSRPPLLPTVTPSQTAAAAVVGTAWLQDVPAYLVGRAGSSGRHAQSVSPPRQAQTYSYPTATHAIALSLVSESSPVPHPPSQCTEGRAPTTNVEEGSAHLGDLLVLSETPLEAAAEGSPVSRTGALSTANVAELKQEGEGAASTVSSAQPAHPLSASSTPKSPPPLPLSSAPPHRVLLAPPRSLSRPSDAQAADTSAVAESFSSSVASASAHSGDAGKAEAAGVAAQDDASAVEAEEPVVDTPVQLATDPINDEVMGTELGEVAAKEEAHAVGDHQPNVSDDAPPSRQTVSEQLPEAHTTAAAATTTTAAPSQTESLKPKEATEEKAGEKEASTEDAPTWQEVLVNDTDPVATAAATTTEVGKPSYDRQYRAMSADRKQLVLDTIRSDLNTAPKSPLSGSARRRSHSHSPTHAKSAERHLPGSCGGGGPPPLTPRTLSAHRLMQRRRPSTEAAASVTSTHARGSCCSVHGGSGPTARVAAVAAAVAQRPPAEMAEKKTTMNGEGRRTATSSRPPSLPLTPTASPRLDVQHMLEIAYDDAVAKLFTVYTFFAEARHETVTRITTVPAVAGANGKGATRGQVSKAGSRASTTRTIAGSGTSKQTEARTENAPGRSRLMVEQVTQYAVSLLSFWRFCVLTGYLAPITRLAILTRQRLQCRPSGADNTSDNDGERGAKAATSSSQRAPSHEAPLESPRRKGEAAPSPLLLPALSQTTVETEEIGGVPKQTPLYLPLSVCDERALVAVLHRCGLRTRGYHVLASMDFRSFRRVVLFLWMWEQQAATTLESVVTAAEAAEPHDRGSGAGLEKEKRSAPDVLRGPREGSDDDDDEAFGQQLKQRLFAQADTLPGLDSMSEEEVIAAYTEVFERAAERVPGLRVFATQRLGPLNVPAPSNGPLVRGGRGEGGGGTTSGQAVALTLSPIAANPIDRVASLPSSPRTPQAVVAGETAVTPAAAPSHPQSTPTLPRASSSAETPPCHVTPGLIAADELMLLLVTNEGTLRQLFDAYSRPQRVRRSAHYEPPTAAAAAAAVSNPVSFISESQLALPLQLYGEAASGGGRTSSYSRRGPSTTNTAAAASASVKGYRDHWSSINGSRDRGGRGGLTGRTASPAARRPPSAAAHPSQPPATARVRDSAVAASPFARRIAEQDVLWKVRQLLADGAEDNRVVFKATQDVVPAITYDGFQALFRTLDVFPSLLTQALLQRAFIDALRSPLLCSTPLSSSPSSASSFPPSGGSSREAPAGSASAHAALPEEEVQLLYSGKAHDIIAALPFLAFVEAFVRVALTAFSIAGDVDAEAFPTAVAKVAGLMRWVNQQVRLGLVQQRCHSSQVMPRRTVTRFEFPAKLKLFCTVAPTAADGPVLPRSQTQRKSPTASLAVGSAPPRTAPIRGTVK